MSKLSSYINEIVSFVIMLLMLVALISGQANAPAYKLAALNAAHDEAVRISHIRLEDD
jgi:C4-dicarboxylate transporter